MSAVDRRRSSTGVTDIGEDHATYSVEELFQKYSIATIQTLNNQYKADAEKAKNDLQQLVSGKYRDLISITDQINDTYECSKAFNLHLADFSFKSAKFVKFSSPEFASFQKRLDFSTISDLRQTETTRVINDVIFEKLLYLDTLLKKTYYKTSALLHTSNYIYFAKLYYILQTKYLSDIKNSKLTEDIFEKSKNAFLQFLTHQIAVYGLSNKLFNDTDISSSFQSFDLSQVVSSNPLIYLEIDDDFEVRNESKDIGNALELHLDLPERYDQNTSPIVNYLICYILLTSKDISISRSTMLFEFLNIKYNYLKELLTKVNIDASNYNKINFFNVLRYIENTFEYINEYFENNDVKNPLVKHLTNSTKRWNILNDPFFDSSTLKINIDPILISLPPSSLKDLRDFKTKFVKIISVFFDGLTINLKEHFDQLGQSLFVFKLLLVSLKKLELTCGNMGSRSQVIKLISDDDMLFDIMKSISANCNQLYQNHLNAFSKLIALAETKYSQDSSEFNLFTSKFVNLVDDNLTAYYNHILEASSNSTFSFEQDLVKKLHSWFHLNKELLLLFELSEQSDNKYFDLHEVTNYLSAETEINWGKFNKKKLIDEFTSLKSELISKFWEVYDSFYQELLSITDNRINESDLNGIYYSIKVLNSLKKCLSESGLDIPTIEKQLITLDSNISNNYGKIFEVLTSRPDQPSSISFIDQFESIVSSSASDGTASDEIILQVLAKLSSSVFKLASSLLNPDNDDYELDYKKGVVFSSSDDIFKTCKNRWVEQLIESVYTMVKIEEVTLTKAIVLHSCILFMKFFATKDPKITDEESKRISLVEIDSTELSRIADGVKEIYKASENTYYPLNA